MTHDELKDEAVYDRDRLERHLWQIQRTTGLDRRKVLRLFASSLAVGAAGGMVPGSMRQASAQQALTPIVKPTPSDLFYTLGTNREMRWEAMRGQDYTVPNELFFVRNHTVTPRLAADTWRLQIFGSGVATPIELTYADLLDMESVTRTRAIECAGNARSFFGSQQGTPAPGTQWKLGAIGVAEWEGVPLWKVLKKAGVKQTAVDIMPQGLDNPVTGQGNVRRPLPIEKALDKDTLLVFRMNGEVLPPDHGHPVRLLVPGWGGISSIKWIGSIEVSETPLFSPWNTTQYRFFGPEYAPDFPPVTTHKVKSALELPFPATLQAGRNMLTGRSWTGSGKKIHRVEVSFDGGFNWVRARTSGPDKEQAWTRWTVMWDAMPGHYTVKVRATDSDGLVQPDSLPFNSQGYSFWAVVNHPVTVNA
ncbi:sulfite oxidase-like protein [Ramlibacter tataouinensis TTB310]|uniref:Sulfite oxidase-like protein n=1 Tax=Ramlibacter tataouinensis (strain ATCC BAA-407 / DSM 14655 / LMG 21543 / TTB310) TaxID=365046 RepID=F5Y4S8_RAMTT|nr:sulfite oxidase-like protein [Ramlibacter tataouinensis TTB310]